MSSNIEDRDANSVFSDFISLFRCDTFSDKSEILLLIELLHMLVLDNNSSILSTLFIVSLISALSLHLVKMCGVLRAALRADAWNDDASGLRFGVEQYWPGWPGGIYDSLKSRDILLVRLTGVGGTGVEVGVVGLTSVGGFPSLGTRTAKLTLGHNTGLAWDR
jgi:hypothetical protein